MVCPPAHRSSCAVRTCPPYPSMRSDRLGSLSAGVGKSCLLLRFSEDSFTSSFITTIGCATASAARAVVTPSYGSAANGTDGGRGKNFAGLTSKSRKSCWTTNGSSYKSGTRPARSASGRSQAVRSPAMSAETCRLCPFKSQYGVVLQPVPGWPRLTNI